MTRFDDGILARPKSAFAKKPKKNRARIVARSTKARHGQADWNKVTRAMIEVNGGHCAVFPHLRATEGHHRLPRSQGGANILANCLPVSRDGQKYIHAHPEEAYERRWMVRSTDSAANSLRIQKFEKVFGPRRTTSPPPACD